VRQLRHAFGRDLGKGELHRADACPRLLARGQQLRDIGEAAPAALDFVGRPPIGEAQRLRHLRLGA
jgi:hypothetical protein